MGSLTLCLLYTDRLRGVAYGPCLRHSGFVGIISAGLKSGVNKIGRAYGSRVIWEIVLVIIGKRGSPTLCLLYTDGLRGVAYGPCLRQAGFVGIISAGLKSCLPP